MTGAEHYKEAERLLSRAMRVHSPDHFTPVAPDESAHCIAAAQVHATLALAAATALNRPGGDDAGMYVADADEWEVAASAASQIKKGISA